MKIAAKRNNTNSIVTLICVAVLLITLLVINKVVRSDSMLMVVLQKTCVYALAAVSMNLLNGFTGLFSLGQAGFMALGAYSYALLTIPVEVRANVLYKHAGGIIDFCLPFIPALLIGGVIAAIFAFIIGLPVLRLKSDYLAIATLGFAEIMKNIIMSNDVAPLTNGPDPLSQYATGFGLPTYLAISAISILIIVLLIESSYGRAFKAIRDDEIAAEAMGINLTKHKMMSFTISAFFAGIAGGLLAMFNTTVSAVSYSTIMTYEILLIVVIGGIGSISGSIFATFLFVACREWWLRFLDSETLIPGITRGSFRMVVFSVVIMIIVLFFSRGMFGDKELPQIITNAMEKGRRKRAVADKVGESK